MSPDERREYNREWMRRWKEAHRDDPEYLARRKKWAATHYRNNPEAAKAAQKRWRERQKALRPTKPERSKLSPEETRVRQKERYRLKRLELIAYQKAWAKANPDKVRVSRSLHRRKREAWKRAQGGENVNYRRILERDNWWCGICNNAILGETLQEIHFDHIVPLSKGGLHVESNIQVSHAQCNMRKHNSLGP